jgi:uncharacterized membrane protein
MIFSSILPTLIMLTCLLGADYVSHTTDIRKSQQYMNKSYFLILIVYIVLVVALYHGAVEDARSLAAAAVFGSIIGFFMFSFHAVQNLSAGWILTDVVREIVWGTGLCGIVSLIGYIVSIIARV